MKYDSPFSIPDDAEVYISLCRFLGWKKSKKNEGEECQSQYLGKGSQKIKNNN